MRYTTYIKINIFFHLIVWSQNVCVGKIQALVAVVNDTLTFYGIIQNNPVTIMKLLHSKNPAPDPFLYPH